MSVVVSDTSPVRALVNLGLLGILHSLYGEVIIPVAVARELGQPRDGQTAVDLSGLSFVRVLAASDLSKLQEFQVDLDRGESEALALAIELGADLVLIDELDGRARAKQEGLSILGVLGVLIEAKHQGLISRLAPLLDDLQQKFRFFISEKLVSEVLRLSGE